MTASVIFLLAIPLALSLPDLDQRSAAPDLAPPHRLPQPPCNGKFIDTGAVEAGNSATFLTFRFGADLCPDQFIDPPAG
jgi:hypothetical protein